MLLKNYTKARGLLSLLGFFSFLLFNNSIVNAQCSGSNIITDPVDFQWTFHPASATNPEAYYSGTMEVGETTITFNNGETLTTRAYRQQGGTY